jgi:Concanavalin A-like lectin/glucanases superfamily/PQQ-like domain
MGDGGPIIGPDGAIYFGARDGKLYALNPDGTMRWDFATGGNIASGLSITADGLVYAGSVDGKLYAVGTDGAKRWEFALGGPIGYSSPTVAQDGTIYIAAEDSTLYAIQGSAGLASTPWPAARHDLMNTGRASGQMPSIPRELTDAGISNGEFRFVLYGTPGANYVIQVSFDLVNWTPISTNTIPISGSAAINDPDGLGLHVRFYRAITPPADLVAYYPFDGNAVDASSNGFDGSVYGAVPDADRNGNANSSLKFSGTDEWVKLNVGASYFASDFTLALWLKIDDFQDWYPAIINGDTGFIRLEAAGPVYMGEGHYQMIKFYQYQPGPTGKTFGQVWSGSTFQTGRWYHLAVVRSGLDFRMYVDGVLTGETKETGSIPVAGNYLQVGNDPTFTDSYGHYFHGNIDEVRIYKRALSPSEVQEVYQY